MVKCVRSEVVSGIVLHVENRELHTGNVFSFHIDGDRRDFDVGNYGCAEIADGVVGTCGGKVAVHAILGDMHLDADLLIGGLSGETQGRRTVRKRNCRTGCGVLLGVYLAHAGGGCCMSAAGAIIGHPDLIENGIWKASKKGGQLNLALTIRLTIRFRKATLASPPNLRN